MTDRRRDEDENRLSALAGLLDAYGADPARWPSQRRGDAQRLLAQDDPAGRAARQRQVEARALDSLLSAAATTDGRRLDALTARIVADARRTPQDAKVIPFTGSAIVRGGARRSFRSPRWAAAAVLAASLLVGIVIGPGATGLPALRDAADAFGLGGIADQLAQAPQEDVSGDEDVL